MLRITWTSAVNRGVHGYVIVNRHHLVKLLLRGQEDFKFGSVLNMRLPI